MKTIHLIIILVGFLTYSYAVQGQTNPSDVFLRRYIANVYLIGKRAAATGVLFDLTDSTFTLAEIDRLKPKLKKIMSQHGGTLPYFPFLY